LTDAAEAIEVKLDVDIFRGFGYHAMMIGEWCIIWCCGSRTNTVIYEMFVTFNDDGKIMGGRCYGHRNLRKISGGDDGHPGCCQSRTPASRWKQTSLRVT
jgi:hypothetical protein